MALLRQTWYYRGRQGDREVGMALERDRWKSETVFLSDYAPSPLPVKNISSLSNPIFSHIVLYVQCSDLYFSFNMPRVSLFLLCFRLLFLFCLSLLLTLSSSLYFPIKTVKWIRFGKKTRNFVGLVLLLKNHKCLVLKNRTQLYTKKSR
jgi:hypothetical protein